MRRIRSLAVAVALASAALPAGSGLALADTVTSEGQPFCTDEAELQQFILAMLKQDPTWMKALRTCMAVQGGAKIAVIEHLPSDSDIGHVIRARLFSPSGRSFVGYTLNLGIKER